MDLSKVCWYNDTATRNFIEKHREELSDISSMPITLLAEAITYCTSNDNPFVKELLSRSGHTEQFNAADTNLARYKIICKAAKAFNIVLA